jgi:hypothetical protein
MKNERMKNALISAPFKAILEQNNPNPFAVSTEIKFFISHDISVELVVYDILGNQVALLLSDKLKKGWHSAQFDTEKLAAGAYIYKLKAGNVVETKTMNIIK